MARPAGRVVLEDAVRLNQEEEGGEVEEKEVGGGGDNIRETIVVVCREVVDVWVYLRAEMDSSEPAGLSL